MKDSRTRSDVALGAIATRVLALGGGLGVAVVIATTAADPGSAGPVVAIGAGSGDVPDRRAMDAADPLRLVVTGADVQRISAEYAAEVGREPGPDELRRAVDEFISAEILYRAARLSGTTGDESVLRLVARTRAELLADAEASRTTRSVDEVRAYMALRDERYTEMDETAALALVRADLHRQAADATRDRLRHEAGARFRVVFDRAARERLAAE
jgi:hypothetical protein